MEQPDFSIEVEQPEGNMEHERVPKIKPVEVSIKEVSPANSSFTRVSTETKVPEQNMRSPPQVVQPLEEPEESEASRVAEVEQVTKVSTGMAETIEIPHPQTIFPHIEAYPETSSKQHHFRFKHKSEQTRLIRLWNQIDPSLTVIFNESGKNNVDMTLMRGDQTVGKFQFIHFDRRDRSIRSKHYVKIYLYQFEDSSMFEKAKQTMIDFFQSISIHPRHRSVKRSVTRKKRTHRRMKRTTRRKPHRRS